jgi:arylsulfatase A-like enzyme
MTAALAVVAAACGSGTTIDSGSAPTPPQRGSTPAQSPANAQPTSESALRPGAARAGASHRPNIVFVLTDDLSSDLVRFMPHVLAMRRDGASFSDFFVTDSLCCPSRASIFTGKFPHNTKVVTNGPARGGFTVFHRRHEGRHTFATALRRAGYRTGFFGKYLNRYLPGPHGTQETFIPPGWTDWFGSSEGYRGYDYTFNDNGTLRYYAFRPRDYATTVIGNHALRFIRDQASRRRPFFAEIAPYAPHWPFVPAPRDEYRFPHLALRRPPSFDKPVTHAATWMAGRPPLTRRQIARLRADYRDRAEAVQAVDRLIGRIQAVLRAQGSLGDTYLVFSSDNGFHLGQHRFTAGKMTAFDSDIRVPLVVTGPGVPRGKRVRAMAENVDFAPTFAAIGRTDMGPQRNGRSLLPFLHGRRVRNWRNAILVEHHGPDRNPSDPDFPKSRGASNPPSYEALRLRHALYVAYANGEREYFNLRADPYELHNRAGKLGAGQRRRLQRALGRLASCSGAAGCWAASHVP